MQVPIWKEEIYMFFLVVNFLIQGCKCYYTLLNIKLGVDRTIWRVLILLIIWLIKAIGRILNTGNNWQWWASRWRSAVVMTSPLWRNDAVLTFWNLETDENATLSLYDVETNGQNLEPIFAASTPRVIVHYT